MRWVLLSGRTTAHAVEDRKGTQLPPSEPLPLSPSLATSYTGSKTEKAEQTEPYDCLDRRKPTDLRRFSCPLNLLANGTVVSDIMVSVRSHRPVVVLFSGLNVKERVLLTLNVRS